LHAQTVANAPPSDKFPPWLKPLDTPLVKGQRVDQ